jgi:4'-phosphopantetheinyl transferase
MPCPVTLPAPDIEVWLAALDADARQLERCAMLLSPAERTRARQFHFERDRRRFTVARGMLRTLLGRQTGLSPAAIVFGQSPYGKPYIESAPAAIHFNVAHSADLAIYAISRSCVPGVDIEFLHRDIDEDAVARRFFTRREYAALQRIPAADRKRAFLTCWTRKEAIVKAAGKGLQLPLDSIEVTVAPDAEPQILSITCGRIADWTLYSVNAGRDHVATVAAHRET